VSTGDATGGSVMNVLFAMVMAGFSLGQAMPNVTYFRNGQVKRLNISSYFAFFFIRLFAN
jgi:hypothetical protein